MCVNRACIDIPGPSKGFGVPFGGGMLGSSTKTYKALFSMVIIFGWIPYVNASNN